MRLFVTVCALSIAASLSAAIPASAAGDVLSGNMQSFGYLLGAPWNCSTNVPAMMGRPAYVDQGTATFDTVPGNVVHNHVSTSHYSGDFYFGFSDRMSSYWQVAADNMGGHSFLTSTDGKTNTGTASMGPMSAQDMVTYTKVSPAKVTVHEVLSGTNPATFDSTCTR
jgi:hypothetical protein